MKTINNECMAMSHRLDGSFSLVKPSSLPLAEAQALLRQDEAALLVIPTSYATHLILLTANNVLWRRSDWKQSQIDAAVERLLWDVGANISVDIAKTLEWQSQGDGVYPFDFATAKALYDELIAPIAFELPNKKVLFISAAGKLASIPFGIFVEKIPKGPSGDPETLRSAKWFSDQIAQIYIPSLQSLKFLRQYRKGSGLKRATPFLGFGDPILDGKSVTRGGKRGGKARSSRYGHAARHLKTCEYLANRIEDWGCHPDHEAWVADLRLRHGRKAAFWSA